METERPAQKLREIAEYLARFSDNGQHRRIPGPDAGHCHIVSKDLLLIADAIDGCARSESAAITPEQKAAWRGLEKCVKDTVSGSFLAFAAMMEKDYGISRAQAVEMMDIAYDVNGATK